MQLGDKNTETNTKSFNVVTKNGERRNDMTRPMIGVIN